jgi:hypothetical protein
MLGRPTPEISPDCGYNTTAPKARYAPSFIYEIPVVVHVIQNNSGKGAISAAMVRSQIEVLNEDFRARQGTPGAPGFDTRIQFHLATKDPNGANTTGITNSTNNQWFRDRGSYWNTLAWDTNRFLNIYTNSGGGSLGYVPDIPQSGTLVGSKSDRIVIAWDSFGRNSPGAPYNQGRTLTHEVGHYLGLLHTFDNRCGTSACNTTGDLICDTNPVNSPNYGCPSQASSCNTTDPFHNYMDYGDDTCLWEFTSEQTRRMRCTVEHWRPNLASQCNLASKTQRNAGKNLNTYTATQPVMGSQFTATVDLRGTGYQTAALFGFTGASNGPSLNGYVLLVDFASPLGDLLPLPYQPGPIAKFSFAVPMLPALCGFKLYTQAAHFGGNPDFSLSNSQDLSFGLR